MTELLVAEEELAMLEGAHGFYVDAGLQIRQEHRSELNKMDLCEVLGMVGDEAGQKLIGRIMAACDVDTMRRLVEASDSVREKARLVEVQNPIGGRYLVEHQQARRLRDSRWRAAVKVRCGMEVMAPGPCQLQYADPAKGRCNKRTDTKGDHTLTCEVGCTRIARHNALAAAEFDHARQAGFAAWREADVPSGKP